jgi:hypothetical protein
MNKSLRSRLARLENLALQSAELPTAGPAPVADDSGDLAVELAAEFGQMVDTYRKFCATTQEDAVRQAQEADAAGLERALGSPPHQVTWSDLGALQRSDPQKALERWEQVKAAARAELVDGFRAARALDVADGGCWDRAQFLAIRAELQEGWRPQTGLERQLIDQMAQHRTLMVRWQEVLVAYTMLARSSAKRAACGTEPHAPPRLSDAEAIEQASRMMEQCSRLYLRTLRALQDQRRLTRPVIVRRAGQVNIAGQQVNLAR